MDLISATASVTQLVAYGHWSVKTLLHLYKVVTDGPAIYQDQKCNLMSLLSVIQKLSSQPDADGDIVLSVLDSLIETSNHLLSYLAPEKSSWYILLNKTKISKAFEYLREQREALQLSLSANNRELLLKIRSDSISSLDRQASDSMEKATETLGEHSKPAAEVISISIDHSISANAKPRTRPKFKPTGMRARTAP